MDQSLLLIHTHPQIKHQSCTKITPQVWPKPTKAKRLALRFRPPPSLCFDEVLPGPGAEIAHRAQALRPGGKGLNRDSQGLMCKGKFWVC